MDLSDTRKMAAGGRTEMQNAAGNNAGSRPAGRQKRILTVHMDKMNASRG